MSTQLRSQEGKKYPISKVFVGGVLDEAALEKYGIPRLSGSFAYSLFMANAAVSQEPQAYITLSHILILVLDRRPYCSHCPLLGR